MFYVREMLVIDIGLDKVLYATTINDANSVNNEQNDDRLVDEVAADVSA